LLHVVRFLLKSWSMKLVRNTEEQRATKYNARFIYIMSDADQKK